MNKISLQFFILLILTFIGLSGAPSMKSNYQYSETYKNETLDRIDSNGSILVDDCTIKKSISVNGSLALHNSTVEEVVLNGQLFISNTQVNLTKVNGSISGGGSQFNELVSVASENTNFKDCELNSLLIRKTENPNSTQVVNLLGNTIVNKNITFEVPGGQVIVSKHAQVCGKVENGNIIYR